MERNVLVQNARVNMARPHQPEALDSSRSYSISILRRLSNHEPDLSQQYFPPGRFIIIARDMTSINLEDMLDNAGDS